MRGQFDNNMYIIHMPALAGDYNMIMGGILSTFKTISVKATLLYGYSIKMY